MLDKYIIMLLLIILVQPIFGHFQLLYIKRKR
nr:MAG TPA: hypothetical protein [Siphoviridae sp. ctTYz13]